jgi:Tol biopolymer transport system component
MLGIALLFVTCGAAIAAPPRPHVFAPGMISGPQNDASPAFTPDGRTVFFMRGEHGNWTLMQSQRIDGGWSTPQVTPFSGHWRDLDPAMAPDGSYMLFVSNRPIKPDGKKLDAFDRHGKVYPGYGMNIWRVDRKGDGWSKPVRLPAYINTSTATFAPSIAADGSIYYMAHDKSGTARLFRAGYRNGRYQKPMLVALGHADDTIRDPAIAPDQSFIVFSIYHAGGKQQLRLAIAFRENGHWGKPIDLGNAVNDARYALGSQLGPDHHTLYFYNARIDAKHPTGSGTWNNGKMTNIWSLSLAPWLHGHRKPVVSRHVANPRASLTGTSP